MDNIIVNKLGYEDETYEPIYTKSLIGNKENGWYDRHSPSIRQQIWFETLAKYKDFKPEKPSVKYNYTPRHTDLNPLIKNATYDTVVEIKDLDTLYAAKELVDCGYKPLVLNMADWHYAGGCVGGGAKTQEEELFRRSNYCKHLLQSEYPLGVYDAIVSYDVEVYREGPDKDYALLENTWKCHMIASPALDSPQLKYHDNEYLLMSDDWDIMYNKVKQLFYYAVKEGCDSIILSAWGCGAFHLPAKEIARIFKNVLRETNGCLRKVVFAVTNHKNNYDIFKSIMENE